MSAPVDAASGKGFARFVGDTGSHLDEASEFLRRVHEDNGVVLVHSVEGASRAATAVLAYLIRVERKPLKQALLDLNLQRGVVRPNNSFLLQLADYEAAHLHGSSVRSLVGREEREGKRGSAVATLLPPPLLLLLLLLLLLPPLPPPLLLLLLRGAARR